MNSSIFSTSEKTLVASFIAFVESILKSNKVKRDVKESLEVSIQCLSDAFQLDSSASSDQIKRVDLLSILKSSLNETTPMSISKETRGKAEEFKKSGNDALSQKDYERAVELYSNAIRIDPYNAVYYCNRAAAYSFLGKDEEVVQDCQKSTELDSNYAKAYTRLGLAYFNLHDYSKSVEAYKKALALDSCNTSIESGYKAALSKLSGTSSSSSGSSSPPPPSSSSSSSSSPMSSSPSGMDFGSLLKDPNMVNMAKNLMSNGGFADLLKNPNIAQMAQNMFGGDPQTMQNMFQTLSKASSTSPPSNQENE